jgi:CO/xanthine dehydrogenase FAD-binding subunit
VNTPSRDGRALPLASDLGELMRRFASIQIRNAGTVGGNIANGSPIGDLPPALIALGATLRLRRGGEMRERPLEDFFIAYGKQDRAPGEFVESVFVPNLGTDMRFACYKLSKRFRSGYLRRHGRVPSDARRRPDHRCASGFWRHGWNTYRARLAERR